VIFNYTEQIDLNFIKKFTKLNKLQVLDFGCGLGVWSKKILKDKSLQKIVLYDVNKKIIEKVKKKYNVKKIHVSSNFNQIVDKKKFNLVIMSSVIQYIHKDKLKKIIKKISNNCPKKNKDFYIFIIDIPRFFRSFEFILLPFFDFKRFLFVTKLLNNKGYKKIKYHLHDENSFSFLYKNFHITKTKNLLNLKFLRYSLILKLKKK
jgi:2-polyprenyl-3-methyl-5-hydroxy-6-metoxy-1,4-benzoquinol methylase